MNLENNKCMSGYKGRLRFRGRAAIGNVDNIVVCDINAVSGLKYLVK